MGRIDKQSRPNVRLCWQFFENRVPEHVVLSIPKSPNFWIESMTVSETLTLCGAHSPLDIIAASSFSCFLPFLFLTHPPLLVSRCSLLRLNRFDVHLSLTVLLPRLPPKRITVSLRGAFLSSRRLVASIPHSMPLFSFCIVTFGLMQPPRSSYNEFL